VRFMSVVGGADIKSTLLTTGLAVVCL